MLAGEELKGGKEKMYKLKTLAIIFFAVVLIGGLYIQVLLDCLSELDSTVIYAYEEQPDPKTFENICKYYARLKNESAAGKMFTMICHKFEDINKGFGESDEPGWSDIYLPALQILIDAYPDWENANFDI